MPLPNASSVSNCLQSAPPDTLTPPATDLTGFTLYASDESPESLADAREWLKTNRLTPDDAKLIQHKGQTMVIAKRTPESWKSNTASW